MFVAILIMPVMALAVILYFIIEDKSMLAWILLPLALYCSLIYIFKKQVNFWYYTRFPPSMDYDMRMVIQRFFPFYKNLDPAEKKRFESRLELFKTDKEYVSKELEEFPEDVKTLMVANAIQVTFGLKDFLLSHWSVFVAYRQPFHTPKIKEFHTGENDPEDGVIILSIDPMIHGIMEPKDGYNMALHQAAAAWQYEKGLKNSDFIFIEALEGDLKTEYLKIMATIRNRTKSFEKDYSLYTENDLFGVSVEHFFNASDKFEELLPDTYQALKNILNLNPKSKEYPVIDAQLI